MIARLKNQQCQSKADGSSCHSHTRPNPSRALMSTWSQTQKGFLNTEGRQDCSTGNVKRNTQTWLPDCFQAAETIRQQLVARQDSWNCGLMCDLITVIGLLNLGRPGPKQHINTCSWWEKKGIVRTEISWSSTQIQQESVLNYPI